MADQHEIDGWRKAYADFSRDQLIAVLHSKVPHCAEYIAAQQRLVEMESAHWADHAGGG
jgi:hypothetical protein